MKKEVQGLRKSTESRPATHARGFAGIVRRAFSNDRNAWQRKRNWLASELKHAAKPLAVFGAADSLALDVLETCERNGIAVPEEVAIVGAGNCLLAVDAMHTPISSIDGNLELLGYRGAELLNRLMAGKPAPKHPIRIPPVGLIVHQRCELMEVKHSGVAKSLRFHLGALPRADPH